MFNIFNYQDHKKEIDKLRETIRIQEEELRQLREDRQRWVRQQKEFGTTFDKTERTLVNEINEECRRTSEVLGLNPRKVNLTRFVQTTVKPVLSDHIKQDIFLAFSDRLLLIAAWK